MAIAIFAGLVMIVIIVVVVKYAKGDDLRIV
ncbi:MAG: hypothetical protein US98_C0010G0009 [Parcubacteria group bacterium GW2011_GWC1_38_6]|nr:MAG: hypothetical protein US98_C0010G0009 [Parcubacteria group bacterium GW2011_GWC1_38_6]